MALQTCFHGLMATLVLSFTLGVFGSSVQAQVAEPQKPILTIKPSKAFLKQRGGWPVAYFAKDEEFAILATGSASTHPGIDHLDCRTGAIRTLIDVERLEDCCFPSGQNTFLIAVREEGRIWIEQYDLDGNRLERITGTKLDNEHGARVFWSPDQGNPYVILGSQILELIEGKLEPLLKLDFAISSVATIKLCKGNLFIPHDDKLHVVNLVEKTQTVACRFDDPIRCFDVSAKSNRIFVVHSSDGFYRAPSVLTVINWNANGFDLGEEINFPFRPFRVSFIGDERLVLSQPEIKTYCYDLKNRKIIWERNGGEIGVSPSQKIIAVETLSRIKLLDPDGVRVSKISGHDQLITQVHLDQDRNELKTLQRDGLLLVWDTESGELKSTQEFDSQTYCGGDLQNDEFFSAIKDRLGYIKLSCFNSNRDLKYEVSTVLEEKPFRVVSMGNDEFLAINHEQTEVAVWHDKEWSVKFALTDEKQQDHLIETCVKIPDRNWLIVGVQTESLEASDSSGYYLVPLSDSEIWRVQRRVADPTMRFAFNGDHLLFQSIVLDDLEVARNQLSMIQLQDRKTALAVRTPGDGFLGTACALSPNSKWIAFSRFPGRQESIFMIADAVTGEVEKTIGIPNDFVKNIDPVSHIKFSADSSRVITACQRGRIDVWKIGENE